MDQPDKDAKVAAALVQSVAEQVSDVISDVIRNDVIVGSFRNLKKNLLFEFCYTTDDSSTLKNLTFESTDFQAR